MMSSYSKLLYFPCSFRLKNLFCCSLLLFIFENLDLLASHLLRSTKVHYSQPQFTFLVRNHCPDLIQKGRQMHCVQDPTNLRNGGKEPKSWEGHIMVSKQILKGVATVIPNFLMSSSPHYLPCVPVQASFLVLPSGQGK